MEKTVENVQAMKYNKIGGAENDKIQFRGMLEGNNEPPRIYEKNKPPQTQAYTKPEYERFEKSITPIAENRITGEERALTQKYKNKYNKNIVLFDANGNSGFGGGASLTDRNKIYININVAKEFGYNMIASHEVMESDILHNKELKSDIIDNIIQAIISDPNFEQQKIEFWEAQEGNPPSDYLIAKDIICDRFAEIDNNENLSYKNVLSQETNMTLDFGIDNFRKAIKNNIADTESAFSLPKNSLETQAEKVSKLPTKKSIENVQAMKYNNVVRKPQKKNYVYKKITNADKARVNSDYMVNTKKYTEDIGSVDFDDVSYIYQKNGDEIEILKKFKGSQEFINRIKGEWENGNNEISERSIKINESIRNEKRKSNIVDGSDRGTTGSGTGNRKNIRIGGQRPNINGEEINSNNSTNLEDSNKSSFSLPETDNQGRTLTKEQQEYFKDSKVRDKEGRLIEVYHGTNSEFNVFDSEKSNYGDVSEGLNFFTNKINKEGSPHETTSKEAAPQVRREPSITNSITPNRSSVNTEYSQTSKTDTADTESAFSLPKNNLETQAEKVSKLPTKKSIENVQAMKYNKVESESGLNDKSKDIKGNDRTRRNGDVKESTQGKRKYTWKEYNDWEQRIKPIAENELTNAEKQSINNAKLEYNKEVRLYDEFENGVIL